MSGRGWNRPNSSQAGRDSAAGARLPWCRRGEVLGRSRRAMLAPGRGDRGAPPGAGHAAIASAIVVTGGQAVTVAARPLTARSLTAAPVTATAIAHSPGGATTIAATIAGCSTTGSSTSAASTTALGECRNDGHGHDRQGHRKRSKGVHVGLPRGVTRQHSMCQRYAAWERLCQAAGRLALPVSGCASANPSSFMVAGLD
jgi:hypothetical protein